VGPPPGPPINYRNEPEPQLQLRYHNHDSRALEELYRRHEATLRRSAVAWSHPDRAWSEDALQDLYLHLTQREVQQAYDASRPWLRWSLVVLRNRMNDERDRRARRPAQLEPGSEGAGALTTDEEVAFHEFERELQDCVNRVTQPFREVLELHLIGLDLTTIAERLNIPYGTAGGRLSRARQQVRDCLEEKGYQGGNR
jgi:RNA polymerase sigma factor (sigma-70 family)